MAERAKAHPQPPRLLAAAGPSADDDFVHFALRAAGRGGVSFECFRLWLLPWGYSRDEVATLLAREEARGLILPMIDGDPRTARVALTLEGQRALSPARREKTCT